MREIFDFLDKKLFYELFCCVTHNKIPTRAMDDGLWTSMVISVRTLFWASSLPYCVSKYLHFFKNIFTIKDLVFCILCFYILHLFTKLLCLKRFLRSNLEFKKNCWKNLTSTITGPGSFQENDISSNHIKNKDVYLQLSIYLAGNFKYFGLNDFLEHLWTKLWLKIKKNKKTREIIQKRKWIF